MPKKALPTIIFLLIFLCSCKESVDFTPTLRQIEFTVQTVWKDTNYLFSVVTDNELNATVTVQEPTAIEGLKMTFSPQTVKTEYRGIKNELPLSAFDESSLFAVVYSILLQTDKSQNKIERQEENILIPCEITGTDYRIYFSETGLPLKIESPDTTILFKGISILN